MGVDSVLQKINNEVSRIRETIEEIEESCTKQGGCSFEDSMNIEFYEGMIESFSACTIYLKDVKCYRGRSKCSQPEPIRSNE